MKTKPQFPGATLEEQAGYWVLNQHSPEWTPAQERELQTWLAQSDNHRQEYARALKLWQRLEQLKSVSFPAREAAGQVRAKQLRKRQRVKTALRTAGGSAVAVIIAIGANDFISTDWYSTAKGQQQRVTLADGTEINLNTETALRVKVTNTQRTVYLTQGEAFFSVAHDDSKPFNVIAANGRIHDIGTRFNVYTQQNNTQVTVTDGEVEIISEPTDNREWSWLKSVMQTARQRFFNDYGNQPGIHVTAGQQLAYNTLGEIGTQTKTDTRRITAWKDGRLVFELAPLAEVMAQIARYHPVEFQFADERLKKIKVSASFDTHNLHLILNALQATFPIKAQWLDDRRITIAAAKR